MQTGSLPITNIAWKLKVPLKIKIFFAPSHPRPPVIADPFGQTLPRLFSRPPVVDAVVAAHLGLIPCCLLRPPVRAPSVPAPLRAACLLVLHLCSALALVLHKDRGLL